MSEQQAFFVKIRGRTLGPFDTGRVRQMIQQGQISRVNPVSTDGTSWQKAGDFAQLFQAAPSQRTGDETAERSRESREASRHEPSESRSPDRRSNETSPDQNWYYSVGEQQIGPVSVNVLRNLILGGQLTGADHVWREGMVNWATLGEVPELASLLPGRMGITSTGTHTANSRGMRGSDFQETKLIIRSSSGWLTFIYIIFYIGAALYLVGACASLTLAFRERMFFFFGQALASLLMSAFFFVEATFLNRHNSSMNRFRASEQISDLNHGLQWIGRYWMMTGICMIIGIFLLVMAFIGIVAGWDMVSAFDSTARNMP